MRRGIKLGAYAISALAATTIAVISAEKAISHILLAYAIRIAPKSTYDASEDIDGK
jgi:hypothetical protein